MNEFIKGYALGSEITIIIFLIIRIIATNISDE